MDENRLRLGRITLSWLAILGIGTASVTWGVDEWRRRVMSENDRYAARARFLIMGAENNFRFNDLDGNGIQDYWTGDVAGLYRFGLIERGLAEADDRPLIPLVRSPIPWHGYFVHLMGKDDSVSPPEPYAQVTDAASGRVHHRTKVAVCLYPADPGKSGRYIFMLNDCGAIRRHEWPGPNGGAPKNWPTDNELMSYWTNDCGG
jgi:hypothetical protein